MKGRTMGNAQNCGNGADNLTDWLGNVGSSTSHDPPRPLTGIALTFTFRGKDRRARRQSAGICRPARRTRVGGQRDQ
jgi:hypothetical protein